MASNHKAGPLPVPFSEKDEEIRLQAGRGSAAAMESANPHNCNGGMVGCRRSPPERIKLTAAVKKLGWPALRWRFLPPSSSHSRCTECVSSAL